MTWLIPSWLKWGGAGAVLIGAALLTAYTAGGRNERLQLEAETATSRIDTITDNIKDRDNAEALDDDSLLDALGRWVMRPSGG